MGRRGNYSGSSTPCAKNLIEGGGGVHKWTRQSWLFDFKDADTAETESEKAAVATLKQSFSF